MSLKIKLSNLRKGQETGELIIDLLMVLLVMANLTFIIFDWHFGFAFFLTFNVVNGMIQDLSSDRNNKFIEEVTNIVFESILVREENKELNRVTKEVLTSALDIVKQQVELKQWKLARE